MTITMMKTQIALERVETEQGILKIEGEVSAAGLVVKKLWVMSTDGWEMTSPICPWAEEVFRSNVDLIIGKLVKKYGQSVVHIAGTADVKGMRLR